MYVARFNVRLDRIVIHCDWLLGDQVLIGRKANVNAADADGLTALHKAAANGHQQVGCGSRWLHEKQQRTDTLVQLHDDSN
jgi:ankyrin repeat protein